MSHLLVVEDNDRVADFVARELQAEGYTVATAQTGSDGLVAARATAFDAIVLDRRLPDIQGDEVCLALRAGGIMTPILMLTALDAVEDRVEGLRVGADDYLVKPFAFDELLARVAALIRRNRGFQSEPARLELGDLVLDRETLKVTRGGHVISLTAKELALLEFLMTRPQKVFSRARILSKVWGYSEDPLTNVVEVYIRRLRRKLNDPDAILIVTQRGAGYKLEPTSAPGNLVRS